MDSLIYDLLFLESSLHAQVLLPQCKLSSREEAVDLEICIQHEEICVSAGAMVVRVRGEGLDLKAMTGAELLIRGRIACVSLE